MALWRRLLAALLCTCRDGSFASTGCFCRQMTSWLHSISTGTMSQFRERRTLQEQDNQWEWQMLLSPGFAHQPDKKQLCLPIDLDHSLTCPMVGQRGRGRCNASGWKKLPKWAWLSFGSPLQPREGCRKDVPWLEKEAVLKIFINEPYDLSRSSFAQQDSC